MNRVESILLGAILVMMVLIFISFYLRITELDLRTTELELEVSAITKQLRTPTTVYFELNPDEGWVMRKANK